MFVFKKTYSGKDDTKDWSLTTHLYGNLKDNHKKIWWTVAQWSYGLKHLVENGVVNDIIVLRLKQKFFF